MNQRLKGLGMREKNIQSGLKLGEQMETQGTIDVIVKGLKEFLEVDYCPRDLIERVAVSQRDTQVRLLAAANTRSPR
jgi:hypothetical protein